MKIKETKIKPKKRSYVFFQKKAYNQNLDFSGIFMNKAW